MTWGPTLRLLVHLLQALAPIVLLELGLQPWHRHSAQIVWLVLGHLQLGFPYLLTVKAALAALGHLSQDYLPLAIVSFAMLELGRRWTELIMLLFASSARPVLGQHP